MTPLLSSPCYGWCGGMRGAVGIMIIIMITIMIMIIRRPLVGTTAVQNRGTNL